MKRINIVVIILMFVFIAGAMLIRVVPAYDSVFDEDTIKYTSSDAYYHMHLVDNMVYNYPQSTNFYPYLEYPIGFTQEPSFYSKMITTIVMIVSLGKPTQHIIDMVGVYFPVILASLAVIPVFFIGKLLFNKWAGLLAAGLFAILPGEILGRSILGATDQHIAEVLFSTTAVLFLIMAIKSSIKNEMSFSHITKRDWKTCRMPMLYSIIAGVILGVYLITWLGGLLFVFIFILYVVVQIIINHFRNIKSEYLGIISFIIFLFATVIYVGYSEAYNSYVLIVAMFLPLILTGISSFMMSHDIKKYYYPIILTIIGCVAIGLFTIISPTLVRGLWDNFSYMFIPSGISANTVLEMQPFLSPVGTFSTAVAWGNFTTSFFLIENVAIPGIGLISLVIMIGLYIKYKHENWLLFLLWTIVILVAMLIQRRFAYYFAVNIAILSAYLAWGILWLAGGKNIVKNVATKKNLIYFGNMAVCMVIIVAVLFYPNIVKAKEQSNRASFAPSDAWYESLEWLRYNTPEPFGDADSYYELYDGNGFKYPDTAYSVTSWWDYGYWITRIAHRLPNREPEMDIVSRLFLSNDNGESEAYIDELDTEYIILDYDICLPKYWAMAEWIGRSQSQYYDYYYVIKDNNVVPVLFYHEEYYKTLCVRLYNFDNKSRLVNYATVIVFERRMSLNDVPYNLVREIYSYDNYEQARKKADEAGGIIVGVSPFINPIPLESLEGYEIVYSSDSVRNVQTGLVIPQVKVIKVNE